MGVGQHAAGQAEAKLLATLVRGTGLGGTDTSVSNWATRHEAQNLLVGRSEQTTKMVSPDLIKQGVTRQHMKMWSECRGARGQDRYGNRGESVQHKCDEAVVLEPAKALVAGGLRRRGSAKASTHHRTSFVGCSLGCGKQARAARSSTGESHLSTGVAIVAVPLPLPDHPATEFARQ